MYVGVFPLKFSYGLTIEDIICLFVRCYATSHNKLTDW